MNVVNVFTSVACGPFIDMDGFVITVTVTLDDATSPRESEILTEIVYVPVEKESIDLGESDTLSSQITAGTGPYQYAWYVGGSEVSTLSSFSFVFLSEGTIEVKLVVTDSVSNQASSVFNVTVNSDPSVTITSSQNPTDVGNSVTFTASASGGTGSYSYQWYLNGNAVSGATSSTYTTSFSAVGSNSVYVVIEDSSGISEQSPTISLSVNSDPSVTISSSQNPTDVGNSVTFTASASGGSGSYSYQWYENNAAISGATSSTYTTSFTSSGSISIYVVVTDSTGLSVSSSTLSETINSDLIVTISSSQNPTDVGNSVTFTASASGGTGSYSYQWYLNGNAVSGATSSSYSTSFSTAGTDSVYVIVHDSIGNSVTSSAVNETINSLPEVSFTSEYSTLDQGMQDLFTGTGSGGLGPYNYTWTANNVIIGYSSTESYVFTSPGTYAIDLQIRDADGNMALVSHSIIVHSLPTVSISASRVKVDAGQSVSFSGGITGGTPLFTYSWTINGGSSISNSSEFIWTFATSGNYTMEVTITDKYGFTSVDSLNITVYGDPSVIASSSYSQIDQEATESFRSTIVGGYGPFTYRWILDGNLISSSPSFSYVFNSIGVRTVELEVTDGNGFITSENVSVTVVADPIASFSDEYTTVDAGIQDMFNSTVQYGTGPYNYTWFVNSAAVGYTRDLTYSFKSSGTYIVNLTVRDYFGFSSSSSQRISVAGTPLPTIFANRTSIDQGMSISFLSGISGGVGPYIFTWELDGEVLSHNQSLVYSFASAGTYSISLSVDDSFHESGSCSITIHVNEQLIVKISSNLTKLDAGESAVFSGLISGGNGPYFYSWYVNGNLVASSHNFTYTFNSAGIFAVKLIVTDSLGEEATYSYSIVVYPSLFASLKVSHQTLDENITENINITSLNGTAPYSYALFINGVLVSSSDSYSTYFTIPGIYQITARVNDSSGESIFLETSIVVRPNPEITIITPENRTDANVPITFRAILAGGTGPYNYAWLIGGQVFTNATLSYAFATPGQYEIELTVTDSFGREAISQINETVYSDPSAKLVYPSDIVASVEEPLSLNISGGISPYSAQWYFPGGEQFTGQNITYAFSTSGPNTFQVKVTDSSGYVDSQNFTVDVHLFVDIAANQTSGPGPLAVQFSSSVLGGSGYSFNWSFGNGHYSLEQNPIYCFPTGNYSVHFSAVSANGALGTASMEIESLPAPVTFRYSSNLNITQSFHFEAIPGWDASGPYNTSWSFPNGQTVTGMNISYKFPVYNELNTVIATFSYDHGKTWNQYLTVRMIPAVPSLSFHPPAVIPVDTMLALNATAVAPDSSSFTYSWNINGTLNSGQSVLYYFGHSGIYNISVTVTDSLGASSTEYQNIVVLPLATNSSISISYTRATNGPLTYYTIKVESLDGITAVEAFLGSSSLAITEINSSYSNSGEIDYWNLTLNQGDYQASIYSVEVVVFNNESSSNSITISFVVSPEFSSSSGFSFGSIIGLFGGLSNFLITILTLGGLVIAWETLRRQDNPDVTIVEGSGAKTKRIKLQGKKQTR